jgi:hypothetical protein
MRIMRGLWATICGWVMIFSKLALYSSRGMCCLFGAFGSEASLAPKNTVLWYQSELVGDIFVGADCTRKRIFACSGDGMILGSTLSA